MINFAVFNYKKSVSRIKSINCPDNHNIISKNTSGAPIDIDKHLKPRIHLEFILSDLVLPPKAVKKGKVFKKKKTVGYTERYLMLGHSQLLIARDPNFEKIVGLIPLEGGFCMVKKPRDFGGLIIESTFRQYMFKFENASELVDWYQRVQQVASKEIQLNSYMERVKEQKAGINSQNVQFKYNNTLSQLETAIKEAEKLLRSKAKIETEERDGLDLNDKELRAKKEKIENALGELVTRYSPMSMQRMQGNFAGAAGMHYPMNSSRLMGMGGPGGNRSRDKEPSQSSF